MSDRVQEYIDLRKAQKENDEKIAALELLILKENRDDNRILIVKGRKTVTIKKEAYEKLDMLGVSTEITETRLKVLKEFDVEIQKMILDNPNNIEEKISKESIRIKDVVEEI